MNPDTQISTYLDEAWKTTAPQRHVQRFQTGRQGELAAGRRLVDGGPGVLPRFLFSAGRSSSKEQFWKLVMFVMDVRWISWISKQSQVGYHLIEMISQIYTELI